MKHIYSYVSCVFSQVFLFYDFEFKAICELKPKSKNLTEVGWQQDLIKDIFFQGSVSSCINNWYNKDPIERQQQAADE